MREEKMLDWSTIEYRISEITYSGKYYFTTGHVKEGYYCLIYNSTDENSPVVVVNQQEFLQQAVSEAIKDFTQKFFDNDLEPPLKGMYHNPSDKGVECYGKKQEVVWVDFSQLSDLIGSIVEEKLNSLKISLQ